MIGETITVWTQDEEPVSVMVIEALDDDTYIVQDCEGTILYAVCVDGELRID